ncbi:MAG: ABC transporter, partial [Rhodoferax sp.]|nr:ABC transporter [Actinomycetota bacterium]
AGGTAVLAQRLLEAVFGDQAVRSLATKAREELVTRSVAVLAVDRARLDAVLDGLPVSGEGAAGLAAAVERVEAAR